MNSQQAFKNEYFSKIELKKINNITNITENVKNKILLNRNLKIHPREITRESTQRSLVFNDKDTRIKKENKTRVLCYAVVSVVHAFFNLYL